MSIKMKNLVKKFIDWIFSLDFLLFICELGFALYTAIAMLSWQKGNKWWAAIFALLWLISAFGKHILSDRAKKQCSQLQSDNQILSKRNTDLQERYNSLLRLMDTLFDRQMIALHDEIASFVKGHIRTSVYMYDSTKINFRCFARHSQHTPFCQKNKKDEYPNKGWLQSTWNNQSYRFECDYTDVNDWIITCKKECKENCYNSDCHNTSCVSGKKERLAKTNCAMLSKSELGKKTMKAKSVFGQVLNQGSSPLGIILVEGMGIWDDKSFHKIKELVFKYSNSSLEILSLHGKQLLDLLNTTDMQKDMAEGFQIGERRYAK